MIWAIGILIGLLVSVPVIMSLTICAPKWWESVVVHRWEYSKLGLWWDNRKWTTYTDSEDRIVKVRHHKQNFWTKRREFAWWIKSLLLTPAYVFVAVIGVPVIWYVGCLKVWFYKSCPYTPKWQADDARESWIRTRTNRSYNALWTEFKEVWRPSIVSDEEQVAEYPQWAEPMPRDTWNQPNPRGPETGGI